MVIYLNFFERGECLLKQKCKNCLKIISKLKKIFFRASCADCLCRALAYLHTEHLIVHRDVKLENLLVYYIPDNQSGQRLMIKLADFGLACQLESEDQLLYFFINF